VGRSIPVGRLTVDRLRDAVRLVLGVPAYRVRAGRLRAAIETADGLNRAAGVIEGVFGTGRRAVPAETLRRA
jgi:UDP:flavonoid glycosyltransferase YjiC (YdhE family)